VSDKGDAVTLALLAGVTFRKILTFNGPHYYYVGEEGYGRPGSASMSHRSMQDAAEAWLRDYESLTAKRMRRQQQLRSEGRLP
jgi:hypothetical protein